MDNVQIIKTLIEESNLTVSEVARRAKVSRQTIYNSIESDSGKVILLRKISVACGKDPNYLLLKMGNEDHEEILEESKAPYVKEEKPNRNVDDLYNENVKLTRKLLEMHEKHNALTEKYLKLLESIDSK